MRSSRSLVLGGAALAAGIALTAACAQAAMPAGGSVEARAVQSARKVVVRAEQRARQVNATAGVVTPRPTPAPGKTGSPAKSVPAAVVVPAKAGHPTVRAPQGGPASPAGRPAAPAHARVTPVPRGQVAAVPTATRPTVSAVPVSVPGARLDHQPTYQYNAIGRRDPFAALVGGTEYVPIEAPLEVGAMQVVGIVWGDQDRFAIVEDGRGNSSVLRPGDKVMNGFVESLKRDGVVVTLTADGQTQTVTIPLTRKGDSNAKR
jgi:hypothetical protein